MIEAPTVKNGSRTRQLVLGTGLKIWTGQVREEYLTALQPWSRAVKIYREMRDEATIGALLESIKTPLVSSNFEIHPAEDTSEHKRAADLVERALFTMPGMEWREHVEEAMDFLDFGFSLSEKVFEKNKKGELVPHTLLPVGQETLDRWGDPDEFGEVSAFIQRDPVKNTINSAPMSKLLHFTWRSRKRDPMGWPLLRSLYRPWFFMKNLEVLEAIGIERDVGNTPVASLGETYLTPDQYSKLETALGGLRVDETGFIITPGDIKIEALGSGGKVYDVRTVIRDYQHKIRQRFFADFLSMGTERVGTQALAREMTTFFSLALRAVQVRMLEIWQRQLIRPILELNDLDTEKPPRLAWTRPGATNVQSLMQAIQGGVSSNVLTPDDGLEKWLREQMGLPPTIENPRTPMEMSHPGQGGQGGQPGGPATTGGPVGRRAISGQRTGGGSNAPKAPGERGVDKEPQAKMSDFEVEYAGAQIRVPDSIVDLYPTETTLTAYVTSDSNPGERDEYSRGITAQDEYDYRRLVEDFSGWVIKKIRDGSLDQRFGFPPNYTFSMVDRLRFHGNTPFIVVENATISRFEQADYAVNDPPDSDAFPRDMNMVAYITNDRLTDRILVGDPGSTFDVTDLSRYIYHVERFAGEIMQRIKNGEYASRLNDPLGYRFSIRDLSHPKADPSRGGRDSGLVVVSGNISAYGERADYPLNANGRPTTDLRYALDDDFSSGIVAMSSIYVRVEAETGESLEQHVMLGGTTPTAEAREIGLAKGLEFVDRLRNDGESKPEGPWTVTVWANDTHTMLAKKTARFNESGTDGFIRYEEVNEGDFIQSDFAAAPDDGYPREMHLIIGIQSTEEPYDELGPGGPRFVRTANSPQEYKRILEEVWGDAAREVRRGAFDFIADFVPESFWVSVNDLNWPAAPKDPHGQQAMSKVRRYEEIEDKGDSSSSNYASGTWQVALRAAAGSKHAGQMASLFTGNGQRSEAIHRARLFMSKKWDIPVNALSIVEAKFLDTSDNSESEGESSFAQVDIDIWRQEKGDGEFYTLGSTFIEATIRDKADGKEIGELNALVPARNSSNRTIGLGWIAIGERGGVETVRSIYAALKARYPWITHIEMDRISGAHGGTDDEYRHHRLEEPLDELALFFADTFESPEDITSEMAQVELRPKGSPMPLPRQIYGNPTELDITTSLAHDFLIIDRSTGKDIGEIDVVVPDRGTGDLAFVSMVQIDADRGGIETVQSIRSAFKQQFPWVRRVEGFRVTGSRSVEGATQSVRRFLEEESTKGEPSIPGALSIHTSHFAFEGDDWQLDDPEIYNMDFLKDAIKIFEREVADGDIKPNQAIAGLYDFGRGIIVTQRHAGLPARQLQEIENLLASTLDRWRRTFNFEDSTNGE